jgi:hypothetical protein
MTIEMPLLIAALIAIESGGLDQAIGDGGKAIGCLQIREAVVLDVNRIYGLYLEHTHAYDRQTAKTICILYLKHYGRPDRLGRTPTASDLARIWNGGPDGHTKQATMDYGDRVQALYDAARCARM